MSTSLLLQALAGLSAPALAAAGWSGLRLRRSTAAAAAREAELRQRLGDLEGERDELRRTASCDPLTGVWNYRHLQITLDREIERSRRAEAAAAEPRPLALLMLRIDGFEPVVAEHGRARAGAMLRDLAQRLSVEIRRSDTFGRYGGEEFLVLLPDTGVEGAIHVAERLCWSVRRHRLLDFSPAAPAEQRPAGRNGLTAAVGIAVLPRDGGHAAPLLRAADQALADARAAGGDCWRGATRPGAAAAAQGTAPVTGTAPDTGTALVTGTGSGGERPAPEFDRPAPERAPGGKSGDATPGKVSACADEAPLTSPGTTHAAAGAAARDGVS